MESTMLKCPYCVAKQYGHTPDIINADFCYEECESCNREFCYSVRIKRNYNSIKQDEANL